MSRKAIEGQHGVLNKDSNKELAVQHVCARMHRKSYFAFDQLHRAKIQKLCRRAAQNKPAMEM